MEELTIRQRNRLRHHYTMTSNVIIFGYQKLTDSEKLTYQAIDSFDWCDGEGKRKGYAYPSVETLATRRGVDRRTIFRHITALEAAGLLTREPRPGRPTLLWIEEPSREECNHYLASIGLTRDMADTPTRDIHVTPYKEDESPEADKDVNADQVSRTPSRLERPATNHTSHQARGEARSRREYYASEMTSALGDPRSLGCYRRIAEQCPPDVIFEALSVVKDATNRGVVRHTHGAMFVDLVKRLSMERGIDLDLANEPIPKEEQNIGPPTARGT